MKINTQRLAVTFVVVLSGALSGLALSAVQASAYDFYYCGVSVPGHTDCYDWAGARAVGSFGTNNAYIPYGGAGFVCERVYIYGGGTISRRCGGNYESTGSCPGSDIDSYWRSGYTLDGRAGNNQSLYETVSGHAYSPTCV